MAGVLTTDSTVLCGKDTGTLHGGKVTITSIEKLKANGKRVLVKAGIGPGVFRCKTRGTNVMPCFSPLPGFVTVLQGEASKLKAGGRPVMLDTMSGTTTGIPPGNLPATANQTKLKAI